MKLVCSQAELNSALQLVSRAVASRPTHPVLANVLLTADAGTDRLSLTGFDLNLGIQTSLPASVDTSGAVTLPAYTLVNAGLSYQDENFGVNLTVKNLTDETYYRANFPDLFGSQIVLPELPRHFNVKFSYKF